MAQPPPPPGSDMPELKSESGELPHPCVYFPT